MLKREISFVERIGKMHDPLQQFYLASLKVMTPGGGWPVELITRKSYDFASGDDPVEVCAFPDALVWE